MLIYLSGRKGRAGKATSSCRAEGPGEERCGCFILQVALSSSVCSVKCASLRNQCHPKFRLTISSILLRSRAAHVQDVPRCYRQKKKFIAQPEGVLQSALVYTGSTLDGPEVHTPSTHGRGRMYLVSVCL